MSNKKIGKLPDCYNFLPDKTILKARDMISIFGYANQENLTRAYANNVIPKPGKFTGRYGQTCRVFWKLGDIRKFIKNQMNEA